MGVINVGNISIEAGSFKISGNRLIVDTRVIELCDYGGRVQLRGTDVSVDHIKFDKDILVEGRVSRAVVDKHLVVVGKVEKFFVDSRRCFFNNTASEDFKKDKKALSSRLGSKRVIVKISGYFSNILVESSSGVSNEVWVKGNCAYIKSNNLSVKGNVASARAGESMYVSKK